VLLNYKILFASGEQKLNMIASSQQWGWQTPVTDAIIYSQAFIYVALSAWLIWRYQRQVRTTLPNFNPQIFAWLWTILLLDLTIWLLKAVGGGSAMSAMSVMGDVLIVVFIYSITLARWRNPSLFKIEQRLELVPETQLKAQNQSKTEGALDSAIRSSLLSAVQEYMRVNEAYRDNQLTLTRLAAGQLAVATVNLTPKVQLARIERPFRPNGPY
jgi:hypothetical protein